MKLTLNHLNNTILAYTGVPNNEMYPGILNQAIPRTLRQKYNHFYECAKPYMAEIGQHFKEWEDAGRTEEAQKILNDAMNVEVEIPFNLIPASEIDAFNGTTTQHQEIFLYVISDKNPFAEITAPAEVPEPTTEDPKETIIVDLTDQTPKE